MVVPVIDFSKLDGAERAETMAQIANGCEEWGFFQLVNHGIPLELLERVKKVCSECYRLREVGFRASEPVRTLEASMWQLVQDLRGGVRMVGEPQVHPVVPHSCGSMALLIEPQYEDFFSRGLDPRVNHWPVSRGPGMCDSIRDAVDWGNANPAEAERVGRRGQRLMQDLRMAAVYDYMLHLLTEYAALMDFRPAPPPTAQEACEGSVLCLADDKQRRFLEASAAKPAAEEPCVLPPE